MKPRQKPLDTAIVTVKTSLKSILDFTSTELNDLTYEQKDKRIQDTVLRTNNLIFHTTHFLELYLFYLFQTNQELPTLTEQFLTWCMKAVSSDSEQLGRYSEEARQVIRPLNEFYREHYEPLLGQNPEDQKVDRSYMGNILTSYEANDILKNISTNISVHFADHCKAWVNRHWDLKGKLKAIDHQSELSEEQKKLAKRDLSTQMRLVKEDLFSPLETTYRSLPEYHQWLDTNKAHIAKALYHTDPSKNHIYYDVAANPLSYLRSMIFVVLKLRELGRNISWLPVRSSFVPRYITIDTASLIKMMVDKGSDSLCKKVKDSSNAVWSAFFSTEKKVFRKKGYAFYGMIRTDGVGVSILFYRTKPPEESEGRSKELYVDDADVGVYEGDDINDVTVVGIDIGKDDLIYCTDGKKFFRYTANQRRFETRRKRYAKLEEELKKTTTIDGKTVKEWETGLSAETKYATDIEGLERYLSLKLPLYYGLRTYYHDPLRRKLRWNTYINTQRSEAKMINNFKAKYGSDAVIAIGDYSQGSYHMKGKAPAIGKGFRKLFRNAGFEVFLVDEFRTSCKCHNCGSDAVKWLYRKNHKPRPKDERRAKTYKEQILVHGLLRCTSANGCGSLWNRDVNGCLNIRSLAVTALRGKERPEPFRRPGRQFQVGENVPLPN